MYQPYLWAGKESEKSPKEYWTGRMPSACGLTEESLNWLSGVYGWFASFRRRA